MLGEHPTVFVVDDDRDMRDSLQWLLESAGFRVESYESAEQFLRRGELRRPGCMLLDVRMPGIGGLGLLERMNRSAAHLPVILFTGHGDVTMAVNALKAGAFDFVEKPATHQQILERVEHALAFNGSLRVREAERARLDAMLGNLSKRESEVLEHLMQGHSNKMMAMQLGISERTIEKHRESLMQKMGARSLAALIRMVVLHRSEEDEKRCQLRRIPH